MKIKVLGRIVNVTVLAYKLYHSMLVMTTTVSLVFLSGIVNAYILVICFGMVTNVKLDSNNLTSFYKHMHFILSVSSNILIYTYILQHYLHSHSMGHHSYHFQWCQQLFCLFEQMLISYINKCDIYIYISHNTKIECIIYFLFNLQMLIQCNIAGR